MMRFGIMLANDFTHSAITKPIIKGTADMSWNPCMSDLEESLKTMPRSVTPGQLARFDE